MTTFRAAYREHAAQRARDRAEHARRSTPRLVAVFSEDRLASLQRGSPGEIRAVLEAVLSAARPLLRRHERLELARDQIGFPYRPGALVHELVLASEAGRNDRLDEVATRLRTVANAVVVPPRRST